MLLRSGTGGAPDAGSVNPFVQTNSRNATPRSYTLHIVQGEPPSPRAPNTVYTNSNDPEAAIHLSMRNYIPDLGYDGTGNAELEQVDRYGLPRVTLNQADGTRLTGGSGDPVSAPANRTMRRRPNTNRTAAPSRSSNRLRGARR